MIEALGYIFLGGVQAVGAITIGTWLGRKIVKWTYRSTE